MRRLAWNFILIGRKAKSDRDMEDGNPKAMDLCPTGSQIDSEQWP